MWAQLLKEKQAVSVSEGNIEWAVFTRYMFSKSIPGDKFDTFVESMPDKLFEKERDVIMKNCLKKTSHHYVYVTVLSVGLDKYNTNFSQIQTDIKSELEALLAEKQTEASKFYSVGVAPEQHAPRAPRCTPSCIESATDAPAPAPPPPPHTLSLTGHCTKVERWKN